jgi:hypothetical protein
MNSDIPSRNGNVTRHTNVVEEGVRAEKNEVARALTETFRYSYDKDGDRL